MKKLILIVAAAILASGLAIAQSMQVKSTDRKLEEEFTKLYRAWDDALVKVNLNALGSLYADGYYSIGPDGTSSSKEELLNDLKSGKDSISSATTDDMKVARHGDTVVVTSRWTAKEMLEGKDVSGQSRWTDVWVKRAGRWQVVTTHGSDTTDKDADATQKITQSYKEWDRAQVHNDVSALVRIMGDDYVGTSSDGEVASKAKVLADIKSGQETTSSAVTDQLKITVYRNTAVATGRWTASGKSKGKEWTGPYRFTDTWVRRNGNWQVVADHWSKIEAK